MKKIITVLIVLMCCASTNVFAQLKEVRGVRTEFKKQTCYCQQCRKFHSGYEFKNENNYSVWIDAELLNRGYVENNKKIEPTVIDTKSFTLKAGETYVWDCLFNCNRHIYSTEWYYVNFKAYKAE